MLLTGSSSTIGAMHVATGLATFALANALQDGFERAAVLREVDRAHAIGQAHYVRRLRQRKAEAALAADGAATRLMANRGRIHGN